MKTDSACVAMISLFKSSSYELGFDIHAGKAPTNLMVRQIGISTVRVSWTPPPNPPRDGYRISTTSDFGTGISVVSTASSRDVAQQPGTSNYWLVTLYMISAVIGPVSATVRGEEMCHICL